jgi:RIO kinase 1
MVKMWAEKEMRNLARLHAAGIPCPKPIELRLHVLVMEFLGTDGTAAPRLRDAGLPPSRMRRAYTEVILILRALYHQCRLVHADFSEYNLLVHNDEVHVIDVSQSVELDHPRAFDFLREDCKHANDYFRRQSIATLTNKELFDFVVDPSLQSEKELDETLELLMKKASDRPLVPTVEEEVAEKVWAQAYIPKKLEEVVHFERDHERLQSGSNTEGIYYQAIAGMKEDMSGAKVGNSGVLDAAGKDLEGSISDEDVTDSESDTEDVFFEERKLTKEEIREMRRANKKIVKEQNAEKRKTKIPKHVKKKATKGSKKKR